jgi:pumilio RNA-binding family
LAENSEACDQVINLLEKDRSGSSAVFEWLRGSVQELAVSKCGCRIVQKLFDVLGSEEREALVRELAPCTVELYESPWGNHVLQKIIQVMPTTSLGPIVEDIMRKGYRVVARHKFGCRVIERLIEHSSETESGELLDLIVAEAQQLCRHEFSNFVIQSLIEHGSDRRRGMVVQQLLPDLPMLASHRTASHVVQKMLNNCGPEELAAIVSTIFNPAPPNSLEQIAASRYGSNVVEEMLLCCPGIKEELTRRLANATGDLLSSDYFTRVAAKIGLAVLVDS